MSAIHVLLRNSIDYAGLFPPAGLDMRAVVENYADYQAGPRAWALGRLVLPVGRLSEFEAAAQPQLTAPAKGAWQLSVLLGDDVDRELALVADFNRRHGSAACIDSLELKAASVPALSNAVGQIPPHLQAYIEIPIGGDPRGLIAAIAQSGRRAKVRTGGVTPEAFPAAADLIQFIRTCIQARVPFKATAGLHHPLRAEYRLTYAPDSPRGVMFGFLNLFLTAAFLQAGLHQRDAQRLLEETSLDAFQLEEESVHWNGNHLGLGDLRRSQQDVLTSFGSCSFTEPLEDLQSLHLLDSSVPQR